MRVWMSMCTRGVGTRSKRGREGDGSVTKHVHKRSISESNTC